MGAVVIFLMEAMGNDSPMRERPETDGVTFRVPDTHGYFRSRTAAVVDEPRPGPTESWAIQGVNQNFMDICSHSPHLLQEISSLFPACGITGKASSGVRRNLGGGDDRHRIIWETRELASPLHKARNLAVCEMEPVP